MCNQSSHSHLQITIQALTLQYCFHVLFGWDMIQSLHLGLFIGETVIVEMWCPFISVCFLLLFTRLGNCKITISITLLIHGAVTTGSMEINHSIYPYIVVRLPIWNQYFSSICQALQTVTIEHYYSL